MVSERSLISNSGIKGLELTNYALYVFALQFNFRGIKLHRKELYTSLSLAITSFLFGALINDFVSIINLEMPENSTCQFTVSLLVSKLKLILQNLNHHTL